VADDLTEERARALGTRAEDAEGWEWRPGMRGVDDADGPFLVVAPLDKCGQIGVLYDSDGQRVWINPKPYRWPDLRDDATKGAALGVARRAMGAPEAVVLRCEDGYALHTVDLDPDGPHVIQLAPAGRSEAEAIVCAIEAAPEGGRDG
jgi:hypothetical protein